MTDHALRPPFKDPGLSLPAKHRDARLRVGLLRSAPKGIPQAVIPVTDIFNSGGRHG